MAWAALGVLLSCGGQAGAGDEPPPLTPPVTVPPLPAEPTVLDPDPSPAIPAENHPILVVPGLPMTRRTPPPAAPGRHAEPSPEPVPDAPPPLTAPLGVDGSPGGNAPARVPRYSSEPATGPGPRPLRLEAVPREDLDPSPSPRARPEPEAEDEPPSRPAPRAPQRRGLLGLLPRLPAASRPPADEPIRVEPRSDPAADTALKSRIEAQVRRAVGDRVRDLDVRVVDRRVHIRARVGRFWQKRGVRRTLESLPGLAGYKTTVDVVD
jgi:hypothetical protein